MTGHGMQRKESAHGASIRTLSSCFCMLVLRSGTLKAAWDCSSGLSATCDFKARSAPRDGPVCLTQKLEWTLAFLLFFAGLWAWHRSDEIK